MSRKSLRFTVDRIKQAFFRRQSAAPLPLTLTRERIYILPTRSGLLFAGTLMAMWLAAINYNLSLGHAFVFLMASIGISCMVHTFRNLQHIELLAARGEAIFAGETPQFRLQLRNLRPEPRYMLSIAAHGQSSSLIEVLANGDTNVMITLPAATRGRLALPRLRISSDYPLGLFRAWSTPWPAASLLIYPQALHSPLPDNGSGDTPTRPTPPAPQGEGEFSGLRPHQPGDSLSRIAWKASSRQNELQAPLVRQDSRHSGGHVQLDWHSCPDRDPEQRLQRLCGWILAAEAAGIAYALHLPTQQFACGYGREQQERCLAALALFPQTR